MKRVIDISHLNVGDWLLWENKPRNNSDVTFLIGKVTNFGDGCEESSISGKYFGDIYYGFIKGEIESKQVEKFNEEVVFYNWDIFKLTDKEMDKFREQITLFEI